jgi:hypothetical protein
MFTFKIMFENTFIFLRCVLRLLFYYKNMSFLKISDPNKRDFIVNEFLKTKKRVQQSFLNERLGDAGLQYDLKKLYKPITESQAGLSKELASIKDATQQTTQSLKALPSQLKAISFPQYPAIEAYSDKVESAQTLELGNIASAYLQKYASSKKETDTTFGIRGEKGGFYIGRSPITFQGDDIIVGDNTYVGTPGLWELLTLKDPNDSIYTPADIENYAKILNETDAMRQDKNPNRPKSSRSVKYSKIIRPIWDRSHAPYVGNTAELSPVSQYRGEGVNKGVTTAAIILPSDPNELVNMLSLRMASYKAGNNGVRNEIVSICDTLKNMGVLDNNTYKSLMSHLT